MKKHVILFDGTWNKPDSNIDDNNHETNVLKIKKLIKETSKNNIQQTIWYEPGVGTDWYNHICGGAFGLGLSVKIKEAYKYLINNFSIEDEIYIIGFSRGAYSARSLVGLIRNSGLLKRNKCNLIDQAYQLYRTRDESADSEPAINFRNNNSLNIKIKFLGVWDTVGSLGIPLESFEDFNRKFYEFHDTNISSIVENAFHALAIDENRENFSATLWDPSEKPNQRLEQVWFPGAHANIGGGYKDDKLPNAPLKWMINRAIECGLEIEDPGIDLTGIEYAPITDSYSDFIGGAYKIIKPRYFRKICSTRNGNEKLDETATKRLGNNTDYKPKNAIQFKINN